MKQNAYAGDITLLVTKAVMKRGLGFVCCGFAATACLPAPLRAETVVLAGSMRTTGTLHRHIALTLPKGIKTVVLRLPEPLARKTAFGSTEVGSFEVTSSPIAPLRADITDSAGNRYVELTYTSPLPKTISADTTYKGLVNTADFSTALPRSPLPLSGIPADVATYLKSSSYVQSDDHRIRALALSLMPPGRTEGEFAQVISGYLQRNFGNSSSGFVISHEDAISVILSKTGDQTGWAHLFIALARASGVPARLVSGLVMSGDMSFPNDPTSGATLEQGFSGGQTYWAQLWFPGAGWIDYEPGFTVGFSDSHHVPEGYGRDASDFEGMVEWSGPHPSGTIEESETFNNAGVVDTFQIKCIATTDDRASTFLLSRRAQPPTANSEVVATEGSAGVTR